MAEPRAVVLDVGGVFFVPRPDRIVAAMADHGVAIANDDCTRAHFVGVRALDTSPDERSGWEDYRRAYVDSLGADDVERAIEAQAAAWEEGGLWRHPVDGSAAGLRALGAAGIRLAIVSNSNGTVESVLRETAVCQIGPGDGVEVAVVVDSDVVGVAKPDPAIFTFALDALGLAAEDCVYVGDSVRYDVDGARAAGLHPLHFDPFGFCDAGDHPHLRAVSAAAGYVSV